MKTIKTVILVVSVATMAFISSRAEEANAERSARMSALKMTIEERKRAVEELVSLLQAEHGEEKFIKSELRKRLKDSNLSSSTQLKEWSVNSGTSNVCVTICTDSVSWGDETVLAFREFRFSPDGRLLSISPIKDIRRNGRNPRLNLK